MADVLQMSYSEMEQLAGSFDTASDDLTTLSTNITSFLTNLQTQIDQWKQLSTGYSDDVETTVTNLNNMKNTVVNGSWQGDAAEKFHGETYPVVYDALKEFESTLSDFATTLQNVYTQLEPTLTELNTRVQTGSSNCTEDASFIRNYAEQHQSIG